MKVLLKKVIPLFLALTLIMSVFATMGALSVRAEIVTDELTADDFTHENGLWANFTYQKNPASGGLLAVSNPNNMGNDKGFVLRLKGVAEKFPTKVEVVISSNAAVSSATFAFGEYKSGIQDMTNNTSVNAVKQTKIPLVADSDTKITFSSLPELCQYDTLYFSQFAANDKTRVITVKSINVTYDNVEKQVYKFSSNITGSKVFSFAEDYWQQGEWNSNTGKWGTSTNRISLTKKIPVKEGATYTFTFNKSASPAFAQVLTRVYKSGIGSIADGADMTASANQNLINSNFISPSNSMQVITGSSATNIDSSGTKIKIKEGSGGKYMLLSLYSSSFNATNCAACKATQLADGYSLRITETIGNTTTNLISQNGSSITAPEACDVNDGETFIGWKDDESGDLYPVGHIFNDVSGNKTFSAVSAKIETQEGAGVRWSNTDIKRGLKFTTYISGNVETSELKNYISPATVKTEITGNGKTVEVSNSSNDGNNEYAVESDDKTLVYHGSVTEFQSEESMLNVDFTAKGVAAVIYADGSTMTLESAVTTTRNMADVAQAAYNVLKDDSSEFAVSKCALLKDVYGVQ